MASHEQKISNVLALSSLFLSNVEPFAPFTPNAPTSNAKRYPWKHNADHSLVTTATTFTTAIKAAPSNDETDRNAGRNITNSFQPQQEWNPIDQLNQELDPACPIEDEDCLAFSSLNSISDYDSQLFPSLGTRDAPDPMCDADDTDCQALLPDGPDASSFDSYLATSLQSRYNALKYQRIYHNWRQGKCPTSYIPITTPKSNNGNTIESNDSNDFSSLDWVRKVAMEEYPIVACGGARGGIYVVDLEQKSVLGSVQNVHEVQVPSEESIRSNQSHQSDKSNESNTSSTSNTKDNASNGNIGNNGNVAKRKIARQAMEKLYGKLDGGGVVSISIHGDLVASSGREGGVRLWKIVEDVRDVRDVREEPIPSREEERLNSMGNANDGETQQTSSTESKKKLVSLGHIPDLQHTIVTSLKFDSQHLLWAACYDGTVRAYDTTQLPTPAANSVQSVESPLPRRPSPPSPTSPTSPPSPPFPIQPKYQSDFTDSILDMHLCEELQCGVCATADGGAELFSLEDGQFFVGMMLFDGGAARSALIMRHREDAEDATEQPTGTNSKEGNAPQYSVLCGGLDGVIHRLGLNVDPATNRVNVEHPFDVLEDTNTAIKPRHVGPVMCLTSSSNMNGVFVSGGQDGALRVWDCSNHVSGKDRGSESDGAQGRKDAASPMSPEQKLDCKCIYALTGYKLWLGSACSDGSHLVSDGGENRIIVRDFSIVEESGK